MVLALQSTTPNINMNVEAGLKIEWIELKFPGGGYLGIGKHYRKWILFGHVKVVLPSQTVVVNRIGK